MKRKMQTGMCMNLRFSHKRYANGQDAVYLVSKQWWSESTCSEFLKMHLEIPYQFCAQFCPQNLESFPVQRTASRPVECDENDKASRGFALRKRNDKRKVSGSKQNLIIIALCRKQMQEMVQPFMCSVTAYECAHNCRRDKTESLPLCHFATPAGGSGSMLPIYSHTHPSCGTIHCGIV